MRSDPVTTDGWRGLPGPDWSEATVAGILAGLAASGVLGPSPAVAFDSRGGSRELALLGVDLLTGLGLNCLLGDEPSPTPALGRFVRDNAGVTSGITFTASHNPAGYVGLKLRDADGLSRDVPRLGPVTAPIPQRHSAPAWVSLNAHYAATAGRDLLTALGGFDGRLIIDTAHGALGALARLLPELTWSRSRPLPFFGGVTPDPVVPGNTEAAWRAALGETRHPERLLAAFSDGDGDRLVLATARSGYVSSTEQAAVLCRGGLPAAAVIGTVVTPRMIRHVAVSRQLDWIEVPVGFKHVVGAWRARGRPAALGLEPNGALAYATDRDGYFERDALRALALVVQRCPSVAALDDAVAGLRDRYPGTPEMMTTPLAREEVLRRLSAPLSGWQAEQAGQVTSFTHGSWRILVRRSGTEEATRIYAEAPSELVEAIRNLFGT